MNPTYTDHQLIKRFKGYFIFLCSNRNFVLIVWKSYFFCIQLDLICIMYASWKGRVCHNVEVFQWVTMNIFGTQKRLHCFTPFSKKNIYQQSICIVDKRILQLRNKLFYLEKKIIFLKYKMNCLRTVVSCLCVFWIVNDVLTIFTQQRIYEM